MIFEYHYSRDADSMKINILNIKGALINSITVKNIECEAKTITKWNENKNNNDLPTVVLSGNCNEILFIGPDYVLIR